MTPLRIPDYKELAASPPVSPEKTMQRIFLGMMATFLFCFAVLITMTVTMRTSCSEKACACRR